MAAIHHLVRAHGRLDARLMVEADRAPIVDVAARILEEESQGIGITYSGFCLTALPHRRLPDEQHWSRSSVNGRVSLLVEPGRVRRRHVAAGEDEYELVGVPYGPKARLILLYLQTRAIAENSPEVELGRSMNAWLERMGISAGGRTYTEVRSQAERISRCRLTFFWEGTDGSDGFENTTIVASGIRFRDDDRQGTLWRETVRLSEPFFRALREHPVPVWEPAVRELAGRSMAFDLYVWMAYRLHVLMQPVRISWPALFAQFGGGYKALRQFKPEFRRALDFALAVYPEADVTLTEDGVTLHPSRPPIPEREAARLGCR
ncbi:pirin [Azospirillum sp. RWY-5-1]|uniref:Pirin n=1 Tax=Azospirillum oleiclasticum TaxID=2735135 RepID=A0ABX2TN47_9PROT|nr:replication protein RepA [Azospirillum oleiclasticum]NYZ17982.1 pirin [Azospirillum oleiclasticum]NYZ25143.1 pirin [Azospirillum oleiclasticum]